MPCDHHVTILFFLFAYVECNFVCCEIKFDLIDLKTPPVPVHSALGHSEPNELVFIKILQPKLFALGRV